MPSELVDSPLTDVALGRPTAIPSATRGALQQIVKQQTSSSSRGFGSFSDSLGLPVDDTGHEFLVQLDMWIPTIPITSESQKSEMADSAHFDVSGAPSAEYDSGRSSTNLLTPLSHAPVDFELESIESTLSEFKDAPYIVENTYAASASPSEVSRGLETIGAHLVIDGPPSFVPISSWAQPGSGQLPWQYCRPTAADVRGHSSALYYPVGSIAYPCVGAEPAMDNSWGASQAYLRTQSPHGVLSEGRGARYYCPTVAIDPTLLVPGAAYRFAGRPPLNDQEQPQEQHIDVAPAGAIGPESDMQASCEYHYLESFPESPSSPTTSDASHYPHPDPSETTKHVDKPRDTASNTPAKTKGPRRQSTEKVFPCHWPGCTKSFARSNNLKVHRDGVHLQKRDKVCPFNGCIKAKSGFSRKYDLELHIKKRHSSGSMKTKKTHS
ncbi:hypothetical protein DICSQDRAFT_171914 [Dichomitus squalens LYAD-421 SS1]|uniref:C2H2-type domain-containing protein n=1 Tax=Dichomitus squalens (strain LYAD-421) TaxID=732165 RepID=R7SUB9_DICSQ|nr:uncharacterized protein DICSQDRAFT_171914 [Dichomitus squalens LYAD-421 SS1]EJF59513.1 hypothetical protein DICSQDRAFT_171914 [Dichomitus squalens LYAD-421 SS1]